jgi:hypothetical protein
MRMNIRRAVKTAPADTQAQFFDRGSTEIYKGDMPEWLKGALSKSVESEMVPKVRILLSPPLVRRSRPLVCVGDLRYAITTNSE